MDHLRQTLRNRHTLFQNTIFFLYTNVSIAGVPIDSWKCQKFGDDDFPAISKYFHDPNTNGSTFSFTAEMCVPSINDFFSDPDTPTSSMAEDLVVVVAMLQLVV
jgi:hypothetical protein